MVRPQPFVSSLDREMAWVGVFLRALQEAEGEEDRLRLLGLGVIWLPDRTPQERDSLLGAWPAGRNSFKR